MKEIYSNKFKFNYCPECGGKINYSLQLIKNSLAFGQSTKCDSCEKEWQIKRDDNPELKNMILSPCKVCKNPVELFESRFMDGDKYFGIYCPTCNDTFEVNDDYELLVDLWNKDDDKK